MSSIHHSHLSTMGASNSKAEKSLISRPLAVSLTQETKDDDASTETSVTTNTEDEKASAPKEEDSHLDYKAMAAKSGLPCLTSGLEKFHLDKLNNMLYCARVKHDEKESARPSVQYYCGNWKQGSRIRNESTQETDLMWSFMYHAMRVQRGGEYDHSQPRSKVNQMDQAWKYISDLEAGK
jgi:hypothetical protein